MKKQEWERIMENLIEEKSTKERLEREFKRVKKFDVENGGIYVEITDDPRGWMLGDNTRRIYEIPYKDVESLTGLLFIIDHNDDGTELQVTIYNGEYIGRLMSCKNDDVGSSIKYANINIEEPAIIDVDIGGHINIENIMIGWIRVKIFPGKNIVKKVSDGKTDVLLRVESSETFIRKRIKCGDAVDVSRYNRELTER